MKRCLDSRQRNQQVCISSQRARELTHSKDWRHAGRSCLPRQITATASRFIFYFRFLRKPVAVFPGLNYSGNQSITSDLGVELTFRMLTIYRSDCRTHKSDEFSSRTAKLLRMDSSRIRWSNSPSLSRSLSCKYSVIVFTVASTSRRLIWSSSSRWF
jgi:hypothetical protein